MNKHGFTLIELLTAIIIIAILATVAMPLYEKTVERSHLAQARSILSRLQESKRITMDNMECSSYSLNADAHCPRLKHLNVSFVPGENGYSFQTKEFKYSIYPTGTQSSVAHVNNAVCAERIGGPNQGTQFLYSGFSTDPNDPPVFVCKGANCDQYGFLNTGTFACNFDL